MTSFKAISDRFVPRAPVFGVAPVLPMKAFYGRDAAFEARRARFYAAMAREFGSQGWRFNAAPAILKAKAGRDGRVQDIVKGTVRNPTRRDRRASVAEALQIGKLLDDPTRILAGLAERNYSGSRGDLRRNVARALVSDHELMHCSDLSSPDWLATGGGGGGAPAPPGSERLEATQNWNRVIAVTPPECLALLRRLVIDDEFVWEGLEGKDREELAEDIRLALDFALLAYGHIEWSSMLLRWEVARQMEFRRAVDRARTTRI